MIPSNIKTSEDLSRGFKWNIPKNFNIATACVTKWATETPDKPAIIVDKDQTTEVWNFDELNRLTNKFANTFEALGVQTGDRVAILLSQQVETAAVHLACFKIGAISVPLFVLFGKSAIAYRVENSGACLLVTNQSEIEKIPSPTNNDETEQLKHVILVDGQSNTVPNKQDKRILSWDSLKNTASEQFADKITSAEDPATIIYTSGTTGSPKGALHAHRVLLGHLPGVQLPQNLFPQDGDLFWTPADWAWIGGLLDVLLPSLYFGVPVLAKRFSKFTPEQAFDLIKKHKVQNLFLPPTVLKMMMQAGTDEILQVRSIGSGGETLGTHIQDWSKRTFGVPVNEFYGQTECNLIVSNCHCLFPIKSGSMGKPMIGFDVELIDLEGNIVPCGEIGQVAVKRPNPTLMLEYWRNPEATAAKFLDNWMLTGDLAKRDEDGHLWYVSRDDDLITSAGYRIGPGEIEDCLLSHPHISLAAVVGVPDETRTEVVTAFVVTTNDVSAQDIQTWVKSRVGQHSYPRYVFFVDELPTTATGKIIRAELRKLGSTLVN